MIKYIKWRLAQYFEFRWWKKYLQHKAVGDYLEWKKKYWQKMIALADMPGALKPNACVLDAGCGPAGIFIILEKQKVVAVDPLIDTYENQLSHFKKSDYPDVEFINVQLENFRREGFFDAVFCINAINHVQDYNRALKNLVDSLKQGGTLFFSIDAHNYPALKFVFRLLPGDVLHPHQFTLEDYKRHLAASGIEQLKIVVLKSEFIFSHYLITGIKKAANKN